MTKRVHCAQKSVKAQVWFKNAQIAGYFRSLSTSEIDVL